MGLILGVDFGPESWCFAVHCHSKHIRFLTLDEAEQSCCKDVGGLGRLAGWAGQWTHRGVVGGVNVRMAVDYVKFLRHQK